MHICSPVKSPRETTYNESVNALQTNTFNQWPSETQRQCLRLSDGTDAVIHYAVRYRHIQNISPESLSTDLLETPNAHQHTPLHYAAERGLLNTIPQHLIRTKGILWPSRDKTTPLHLAAQYNFLHHVPTRLLTKKAILTKDTHEITPLHFALKRGQAHLLPPEILTTKNLLQKDLFKNSPLDYACQCNTLSNLESLLTIKTLEELKTSSKAPKGAIPWIQKEIQKNKKFQKVFEEIHNPL
jgi:ankyrin repeat protein